MDMSGSFGVVGPSDEDLNRKAAAMAKTASPPAAGRMLMPGLMNLQAGPTPPVAAAPAAGSPAQQEIDGMNMPAGAPTQGQATPAGVPTVPGGMNMPGEMKKPDAQPSKGAPTAPGVPTAPGSINMPGDMKKPGGAKMTTVSPTQGMDSSSGA
ncbi:unnamed protein product [Larinioides sclopetarius]|uniref:Uncharacterized protein n=1 Tax=Larinioides sclopetarius TaxID=280406 RepID=A0AAV2BQP3_9ARAC